MKMIFADMDGTLCDENGKVNDKTIHSIQEVIRNGYMFVVATGRSIDRIIPSFFQTPLSYIIALNGSQIYDVENKKIEAITIRDNEPFLRQISSPVDIQNDKELMNDIDILDQFCKENSVMAMASVQLGIPKRIVYLKNTNLDIINKIQNNSNSEEVKNYNEKKVLINPTILKREGLTEYWEACASCLDNMGRVLRPYKIELEYYDIDGSQKIETFEGFESTVLSHELDHLDGILHIDIAEEVIEMPASERKKWRQSHEYKVYQKDGDYDSLRDKGKNTITKLYKNYN